MEVLFMVVFTSTAKCNRATLNVIGDTCVLFILLSHQSRRDLRLNRILSLIKRQCQAFCRTGVMKHDTDVMKIGH